MLTLGWSDGNTFMPVNSVLLSSENDKTIVNTPERTDKRTIQISTPQNKKFKSYCLFIIPPECYHRQFILHTNIYIFFCINYRI